MFRMKSKTPVRYLANITNSEKYTRYDWSLNAGEIDDVKSEVIAYVVNAGMNITAKLLLYLNQGKKCYGMNCRPATIYAANVADVMDITGYDSCRMASARIVAVGIF